MGINMIRYIYIFIALFFLISCNSNTKYTNSYNLPEDFVDVGQFIPEVIIDARYNGENNFTGNRVDGYLANKCFLREQAAHALKKATYELVSKNMTFLIFDCYRPQRAVDQFIRWTEDMNDQSTKEMFYPNIKKDKLLGPYIAAKSGHSKGNTIDLTIVSKKENEFKEMNMGSKFDLFDSKSHTVTDLISMKEQENRLFMKELLERNGFENYDLEWWHFTFVSEKNRDYEHMDFIIE